MLVMFSTSLTFAQAPCSSTALNNFIPAKAPTGTIVTLNGSGFMLGAGTTAVKFNGVTATYTVVSDTKITAEVPSGNTTGSVSVVTNGCQATATGFTLLETDCTSTSDIYISELYDHVPGSYGVIELYNPSPTNTITFNGEYRLERAGDIGGTASENNKLTLIGSIGPESTYLVRTYGSGVIGCAIATDADMGEGINENDEFKLFKNNVLIDIARAPDETGYTVIRKPNAVAPTTSYAKNDWTFNSTQSCSNLGFHYAEPITAPQVTITTQPADVMMCGNVATSTFTVAATNATGASYQWKTLDNSGNWVNVSGASYSGGTTPTLTVTTSEALNNSQYYVVITTANCTAISNAAQLVVNPMPKATYVVTNASCTNPKGQIVVTPTAGIGLTYSINNSAYTADTTYSNLEPGTYTITIKSDAGCITTLSGIVVGAAPAAPAEAEAAIIQPTCTVPTATVTISSPLGMQYQLDGGAFQSELIFTDVEPGSHTITVQNTDGCTSVATITVNTVPNAPAQAMGNVAQPTCAATKGVIEILSPVGTGLKYSLNGGAYQEETTFNELEPNATYTVTVQNAEGCLSAPQTFVVDPVPAGPAVAEATLGQPTCVVKTGTITITSPIDASLQYRLNDGAYQSTPEFANLAPGSYTITVQNAEGCATTSAAFIINAQPTVNPATATIEQPTCNIATGSITVTAPIAAGYTYSLNGGTPQTELTFANLTEGSYIITVQTPQGCSSVSAAFVINAQPTSPAVATTSAAQPDCSSQAGSITVTSPTGTGYEYSINGGAFQQSPVFTDLEAANYVITVRNAQGCTSDSAPVTINAPQGGQPVLAGTQGCRPSITGSRYLLEGVASNNSFDVNNATYEWRISGQPQVVGSENIFDVTQYAAEQGLTTTDFPLSFDLKVITPGGCEDTLPFTVDGIFCDIPRGISPNNDTNNDSFDLTGMNVSQLSIFNRYGLEVYKRDNYTNQWHGQTDKGDDLPNGTYFYVVKTAGNTRTGWVYINREN